MTATPTWADDKMIGRVRQGADLELHIKETKVDGLKFINIRDYVPSTKEYGQGTLIRLEHLPSILEFLNERAEYHFGRGGPVKGQQSLPGV
ncbi:MAG TPA: hypothetical protein VFI41_05285 [Gemmatimonadales bacterium]|nr:hypothetical protein [Gemmatimonadales bacterium]